MNKCIIRNLHTKKNLITNSGNEKVEKMLILSNKKKVENRKLGLIYQKFHTIASIVINHN